MSASPMKILCLYHYDPLDRLTGLGPAGLAASTQRFYQNNHLVTEVGEHAQRSLIRHEAQPLAQQQSTGDMSETLLLATDQARSLLLTLAVKNLQQLAYTAYGHHPAESGLSRLSGFNGECPEALTGHYLLGQGKRAFSPILMRFNSPDELSPFGEGGINSYAYCAGDPVNFYDPTGNGRIPFQPWNFIDAAPTGLDLSNKVPVIVKSPLKTIKPTTSKIAKPSLASRNPMLTELFQEPISNTSPSAPSTSTGPRFPIPSTDDLMRHIPNELRQEDYFKDLLYLSQVFDNIQSSTPNFQRTITKQQYKTLNSHFKRKSNIKNKATEKLFRQNLVELFLQIKKTNVDKYNQLARQRFRQ
jgi:RHS repeat-associated protein